jgi:hypothetical protein
MIRGYDVVEVMDAMIGWHNTEDFYVYTSQTPTYINSNALVVSNLVGNEDVHQEVPV